MVCSDLGSVRRCKYHDNHVGYQWYSLILDAGRRRIRRDLAIYYYCVVMSPGPTPSIGIQGIAICGTWHSHGRTAISTIDSCGGCGDARPIVIMGAGCAFSFDRAVQLSGSGYNVVSCNNTYPQYYNYIYGLPLGTRTLGTPSYIIAIG